MLLLGTTYKTISQGEFTVEAENKSMKEKRSFARVALQRKVSIYFQSSDDQERFLSTNISEGGLFLATPKPMAKGTLFWVEFTVRETGKVIRSKVEVCRVVNSEGALPGMGVRFVDLADSDRQELRASLHESQAKFV